MAAVADIVDRALLSEVWRRYRAIRLSVFGSAARGEMTTSSDIDLLVEFAPDAHPTYFSLVEMSDELKRLFGGEHEVDLVTKSSMHPLIWGYAERDLMTLYEEG